MDVNIALTNEDLRRAGDLLRLLRPAYDAEEIVRCLLSQRDRGYRVALGIQENVAVCAAGFVIASRLAWGKHLYIEDLVTDAARRSEGFGGSMLVWLREYARDSGCAQIHLDSGVQNYAAHRFYLREGYNITSHHFSQIQQLG